MGGFTWVPGACVEMPIENALAKCVGAYRDAFLGPRLHSTSCDICFMIIVNFNYILGAFVRYLVLNCLNCPAFLQIIIIKL